LEFLWNFLGKNLEKLGISLEGLEKFGEIWRFAPKAAEALTLALFRTRRCLGSRPSTGYAGEATLAALAATRPSV
jgi:hypothetical protein